MGRILAGLVLLAIVAAFFAFLGMALYVGLIIFGVFLLYGLFISVKNEVLKWWHKSHKKNPEVSVEWYEPNAKEMKDKKVKAINMGEIIIIEEDEKHK